MSVKWKRPELEKIQPIYDMICDCVLGEFAVKDKEIKYLPQPNAEDQSYENLSRYNAYLQRAVFYNVTGRTLDGLVGEIFGREPVIELSSSLDPVLEDANGDGVSLVQSARRACEYNISFGRAGLFVDYPVNPKGASLLDQKEGNIRPTINLYEPTNIINWRSKKRGSKSVLSLVVLMEIETTHKDSFEQKTHDQYRVLRLGKSEENDFPGMSDDPDVYTVEVWRMNGGKSLIAESYQPTDYKGSNLREIPFKFIGSKNNDSVVDQPPLYAMAGLNIAHFRNSADYEESCYITGQATPWATGLTEQWVKDVLHGKITLGSRAGIPLPENANIGLLQAESNSMPFEAMQQKERQMAALGARIVEQQVVQRTATEASLESTVENSILTTIAQNVSDAYSDALDMCLLFVGNGQKSKFELNSDFDLANMSAEDRRQIISEWTQGAISFSEMRTNLKYSGIKLDDLEKALAEIEAAKDATMEREMKQSNAVGQTKDEK